MIPETKLIEIRDRMTLIVAVAVRLDGSRAMLRRAGYGDPLVLLIPAEGGKVANYDPHEWGDRTMNVAHCWIEEHWDDIPDGGLVDVRVVLGEETTPCESEFT